MAAPIGDHNSLKGLLASERIAVPEYQRTYDWPKATVEQLLVCLSEHQNLHQGTLQQNPYFLGNLMIHTELREGRHKWWLVDGQQRLVTLTILAGVVRDLLIENEFYQLAFELQKDIIGDNAAEKPKVKPRDTEKKTSPRELLWPIQTPPDQTVEFKFADDFPTTKNAHLFQLVQPFVAKFPLKQGSTFEINVGANFELLTSIPAGNSVSQLYGNLILDPGATVSTTDNLEFKCQWRREVIENRMRHRWNKNYLIPKHYFKVIRNFLTTEMDNRFASVTKEVLLTDWKDMVAFMAFTTTTFDDATDAIYYFGKLNEASTSQQLNVGDLMRHHTALVRKSPPLQHAKDDDIASSWNSVEETLKEERDKDMVPTFLSSWLTAQGDRKTDRMAYSALKDYSQNKFFNNNTWNKDDFSGWMNRIQEASIEFRQIVFPEIGDPYHLSMKSIELLAKQHRPLFLCGLLAFEKYNLKAEMQRLINIF